LLLINIFHSRYQAQLGNEKGNQKLPQTEALRFGLKIIVCF